MSRKPILPITKMIKTLLYPQQGKIQMLLGINRYKLQRVKQRQKKITSKMIRLVVKVIKELCAGTAVELRGTC